MINRFTIYRTLEEAEKGVSSHEVIQDMLDETGVCVLPSYGFINMSESVLLWKHRDKILSNGHCNIVTTRPISMFLPLNEWQSISGFTAWYRGNEIVEECAVVRLGGDSRNIGTPRYSVDRDYQHRHFWKRRTLSNNLRLDFDIQGDQRFYTVRTRSTSKYFNSFVNGNAHAVWVNYDDSLEHTHSYCQGMKVRGRWNFINNGIKIKRRLRTQTLNTFDINVQIWGAKKFVDISNINFSKISFMGQEKPMIKSPTDLYSIKDSHRIILDPFVYDVRGKRDGIIENVTDLELTGLAKIHGKFEKEVRLANAKFINCTFKNN